MLHQVSEQHNHRRNLALFRHHHGSSAASSPRSGGHDNTTFGFLKHHSRGMQPLPGRASLDAHTAAQQRSPSNLVRPSLPTYASFGHLGGAHVLRHHRCGHHKH